MRLLPGTDSHDTRNPPPDDSGGCADPARLRRSAAGFTLIELIVALVVAGVLAGIGFPAYQELTRTTAARRTVEDLATGFLSARTVAVTHGVDVKICALSGNACAATAADWAGTWAVFEDCNGDNVIDDGAASEACTPDSANVTVNGSERVYVRGDGNEAAWRVETGDDAPGPAVFTYRPSGRILSAMPGASPAWPVTFEIRADALARSHKLVVSRLGHV